MKWLCVVDCEHIEGKCQHDFQPKTCDNSFILLIFFTSRFFSLKIQICPKFNAWLKYSQSCLLYYLWKVKIQGDVQQGLHRLCKSEKKKKHLFHKQCLNDFLIVHTVNGCNVISLIRQLSKVLLLEQSYFMWRAILV